jgi:hypothetical protein
VTGCCPENQKRRFIKKGVPLLDKEFDFLDLILDIRMSHKYVSELGLELDHMKKIDVDRSEIEEEDMPSEEHTPKAKDSPKKFI